MSTAVFEQELFNNPTLADAIVVLTTEPEDECNARLKRAGEATTDQAEPALPAHTTPQSQAAPGRGATSTATEPPAAVTAASIAKKERPNAPAHEVEQIYANACILAANSEFFRACCTRWQSQPSTSKKRKLHSPEDDVSPLDAKPKVKVIVSVQPEEMAAAKEMIRFMYSQTLPDSSGHMDALLLYRLGDKYMLHNLQVACLQHLQREPLNTWSSDEQHLLFSMATKISTDAEVHTGKPLGAAAAEVLDALVRSLQQLELFWQHKPSRQAFMVLPFEVVLQVLQSDELSVRSEDSVLVAALSWLRGDVGTAATPEQRRQVLEAVRLVQLSPWFHHVLVLHAPEARTLLEPATLNRLLLYTHKSMTTGHRRKMLEDSKLLQRWASKRTGPGPEAVQTGLEWDIAEVLAAVRSVRADSSHREERNSEEVFFAGRDFSVMMCVEASEEEGVVAVRASLVANLWLAGSKECSAEWHALFKDKSGADKEWYDAQPEEAVKLGSGWGYSTNIKPGEDPESKLQEWLMFGEAASNGNAALKYKVMLS